MTTFIIKLLMPINFNYDQNSYSNIISTYNSAIDTMRQASNKNDAIRTLKNTNIKGTNVKIGEEGAHQIYNKYSEYNGYSNGRHRF